MNLQEFTNEFIEEIRNESVIQEITPSRVFMNEMVERLESMEYILNPTIKDFYKQGSNSRIMKFNLYSFDEVEKSITFLTNEFIDDKAISSLTQTEIKSFSKRMLNFLDEVYKGTIYKYLDPSSDINILARELQTRLENNVVKLNEDDSIDKIKLIIITNKKIGVRVKNIKLEEFYGRQVELNIWDIERIFNIVSSNREKEPILIDFSSYGSKGIPFLKAEFDQDLDYDAYLSIIPGKLLSDLYWDHGARLLEGNVRAFLSARGKVNKGIRKTINKEPTKFFTYNNGIACTAKNISFSKDGEHITKIEDLQIINGGQTTASLTSAWKKDNADLKNIYVPLKLTIIRSDDYDQLVGNIAKYANSQNKVTDADLFSNHPFHREMEKLSLKISAPPKPNEIHITYWYYERSRGKYQQQQFKLNTQAQKKKFQKKYPKQQVLTKEDFAKFIMAARFLRPDLVSRGRARNMRDFAQKIDVLWNKNKNQFNEEYFKESVVYAILFKTVDKLVKNASWYQVGGIKLNIVPYTISKILYSIPEGYYIDINRIWKEQRIYDSFLVEIDKVAKMANIFLNDSKGKIVTEYAKREDTWEKFKKMSYTPSMEFLNDLISTRIINSKRKQSSKNKAQSKVINIEIEIYNLAQTEGKTYWNRLLMEGIQRNILSLAERKLLKEKICVLSKPRNTKVPNSYEFKQAWKIREKLENEGVLV